MLISILPAIRLLVTSMYRLSLIPGGLMLLCQHFFFFNDTATTEIYTLSLHDALPIYCAIEVRREPLDVFRHGNLADTLDAVDRKSTRLNSSHPSISYAVFCLKKKNRHDIH